MPQLFPGSKAEDYALSPTADSIINTNDRITFQPPKTSKTAQLDPLIATVDGTEFQLRTLTETQVSPGITAFCRTQNFLSLTLVNKTDGSQTLCFQDACPQQQAHWTQVASGITLTEKILTVIAIVLLAVAAVMTDGAALVIVGMIVGLVEGIESLTADLIQTSLSPLPGFTMDTLAWVGPAGASLLMYLAILTPFFSHPSVSAFAPAGSSNAPAAAPFA
jgi:hypothetical protein